MLYRSVMMDSGRWDGFAFRAGDVVISTPPKSGTTWMQMLVGLLIFGGGPFPGPMDQVSPWVDMVNRPVDQVRRELEGQSHRRFLKTHTPLDGIPLRDDVMYLVVGRDPRDVAVSLAHHVKILQFDRFLEQRAEVVGGDGQGMPEASRRMRPINAEEAFQEFLDATNPVLPPVNLRNVLRHLQTGWSLRAEPNVALFHYRDLQADLAGEIRRLAEILSIPLSEDQSIDYAARAGIDQMRKDAARLAPNATDGFWQDPAAFFRAGTTGEWQALTTPAQQAHYNELLASLALPDLLHWAQHGTLTPSPQPPAA